MGFFTFLRKRSSDAERRLSFRRHSSLRHEFEETPQPLSRIPRIVAFVLPVLMITSAFLGGPAFQGNADLWRKQIIYQVGFSPNDLIVDYDRSICSRRGCSPALQCNGREALWRKLAWHNREARLHSKYGFHSNMDLACKRSSL